MIYNFVIPYKSLGGTGIEKYRPRWWKKKKRRDGYTSLTEEQKEVKRAKTRDNYHRRKAASKSSIMTKCGSSNQWMMVIWLMHSVHWFANRLCEWTGTILLTIFHWVVQIIRHSVQACFSWDNLCARKDEQGYWSNWEEHQEHCL